MGALLSAGYNTGSALSASRGASALSRTLANPYQATTAPLQAAENAQAAATAGQQALYGEQADLALSESARNANQRADQIAHFQASQASGYSSSGVMLQGSPMLVMEYTRQKGQEEINAITAQGQAQADFARRQAYVLGQNQNAQLLGDQAQFITQQAQARIAAGSIAQEAAQAGYQNLNRGIGSGIGLLGSVGQSAWQYWRNRKQPPTPSPAGPDPYDPATTNTYNPGSSPFGPNSWNIP